MDLNPNYSLAKSLILLAPPHKNALIPFTLKNEFINYKPIFINGMRKLSRISMYTCELITEVIIAVSGLSNGIQSYIYNYYSKFKYNCNEKIELLGRREQWNMNYILKNILSWN